MITIEQFKEQVKLTTSGGGCLNGEIDISYEKLVTLLGEPNCEGDGYKTDAEWAVSFEKETFAIYNYKTGRNYDPQYGDDVENIRDWHIGGANKEKAARLINLMKSVEFDRCFDKIYPSAIVKKIADSLNYLKRDDLVDLHNYIFPTEKIDKEKVKDI